jgi:hypothetical protein
MWGCDSDAIFRKITRVNVLSETSVMIGTVDSTLQHCVKTLDLHFEYTHPVHMPDKIIPRRLLEMKKVVKYTLGSPNKDYTLYNKYGIKAKCKSCGATVSTSFTFQLQVEVALYSGKSYLKYGKLEIKNEFAYNSKFEFSAGSLKKREYSKLLKALPKYGPKDLGTFYIYGIPLKFTGRLIFTAKIHPLQFKGTASFG